MIDRFTVQKDNEDDTFFIYMEAENKDDEDFIGGKEGFGVFKGDDDDSEMIECIVLPVGYIDAFEKAWDLSQKYTKNNGTH